MRGKTWEQIKTIHETYRMRLDGTQATEQVHEYSDAIEIERAKGQFENAFFYNVSFADGGWKYDEGEEEKARNAFLMHMYWSLPANDRDFTTVVAASMRRWPLKELISEQTKRDFISKGERFFADMTEQYTKSGPDENEGLYAEALHRGLVTTADIAVARYLGHLYRQDTPTVGNSHVAQEDAKLPQQFNPAHRFLDLWQPDFRNSRPIDNAFLLPRYKYAGWAKWEEDQADLYTPFLEFLQEQLAAMDAG